MDKSFESNMTEFCYHALGALKKYDEDIKNRILKGNNSDFYSYDWKGIGIYSTIETILKYLIFINLLDKYRMWSEMSDYYKDSKEDGKLLDLGLHFGDINDESHEELILNVAVEMKWTKLTQDGHFYSNWLPTIKRDITKLCRCNPEYKYAEKYFMQFLFVEQDVFTNQFEEKLRTQLTEQCNAIIDRRTLKKRKIKLVFDDGFETLGRSDSDRYIFKILLWKID